MYLKMKLPTLPTRLPSMQSTKAMLAALRKKLFPRGWLQTVAVLSLVLPFGLFLGLLSSVGLAVLLSFFFGFIAIVVFLVGRFGFSSYREGGNGIFWTSLVFALVLGAAALLVPVRVSALFELWFIALVPWILYSTPRALGESPVMRLVLLLFLFAMAFAVFSTWISPWLNVKAATYQFVYNLKWPLMLLLGFRVCWGENDDRRLRAVIWVFAVVELSSIALDIAAPRAFQALVQTGIEYHRNHNPLLGGLGWRYTGLFNHSGVLAYFASLMFVLVFVQHQLKLVRTGAAVVLGALLMATMLLSGQMQEFSSMLLGCAIVVVACRVRSIWTLAIGAVVTSLIVSVLFVGIAGIAKLQWIGIDWGLLPDVHGLTEARPVLYLDSVRLASKFWPLGTGLGTFGGVGAAYMNRDLYEALGYSTLWWYSMDAGFLMDTYWTNYIAELGWIGSAALMLVPLILNVYCLQRMIAADTPRSKAVWGYAFAGQFVPLGISITSPIYSDPNMAAFALMMLGMAHAYDRRAQAAAHQAAPAAAAADQAPAWPAWPGLARTPNTQR